MCLFELQGGFCLVLPESTGTSNAPEKLLQRNFVPENMYQCSCQQGQKDTCLSAFLSASCAVYTSLSYQLWISGFIRFNGALSLPLWCRHFSSVSSQASVSLPAIAPSNFLTLIIRPASLTDGYGVQVLGLPTAGVFLYHADYHVLFPTHP